MQMRSGIENALLDFATRLDQHGRATLADGLGRPPGWLARRGVGAGSSAPPHP
jgi:uncharacterized membrane protein